MMTKSKKKLKKIHKKNLLIE